MIGFHMEGDDIAPLFAAREALERPCRLVHDKGARAGVGVEGAKPLPHMPALSGRLSETAFQRFRVIAFRGEGPL